MKNLLLLFIILLLSLPLSAQPPRETVKKFIDVQRPVEHQFIEALKKNDFEKCLTYFTATAINTFGRDRLLAELRVISKFYQSYPDPEVVYSMGQPSYGTGTFGHNCNGSIELQSSYVFLTKKKKEKYFFYLYYDDIAPVSQIKLFATQASLNSEVERSLSH